MLTNTFAPHVGGVARSVATSIDVLRQQGHRCLVIAPESQDAEPSADGSVLRVPALEDFNGTGFSLRLPVPGVQAQRVAQFGPDIVHAHHPFLLGDTAAWIAARHEVPLIFTRHTMWEDMVGQVAFESEVLRSFVARLVSDYAELSDHVIAPSTHVERRLRCRGVNTPISVIPTGVSQDRFVDGDREAGRRRHALPADGRVIGHVGRLSPEKNLGFLARAVARHIATEGGYFLVVGAGPSGTEIEHEFRQAGLEDRLRLAGVLTGPELVNAYHSMDVFAFASVTETQGIVVGEALMSGVPVVALHGPGVEDIIQDGTNGFLVDPTDLHGFAAALRAALSWRTDDAPALTRRVRASAEPWRLDVTAKHLLDLYGWWSELKASGLAVAAPRRSRMSRWVATMVGLWGRRLRSAVEVMLPRWQKERSGPPHTRSELTTR